MTLQVVMFGNDGVVIASDMRRVTAHPEEWSVLTTEDDEVKVVLSKSRMTAAACARQMRPDSFVSDVIEAFEEHWGDKPAQLEVVCSDIWQAEVNSRPGDKRDSELLIAHAAGTKLYKAVFSPVEPTGKIRVQSSERSQVKRGKHQGNEGNPAYFFVHRYAPDEPPPVNCLIRLTAHYIWTASQINPAGVGGLALYVAKDGNPFEELPEETLLQLASESQLLDRAIGETLLTPLSAPDSSILQFLKSARGGR